MSLRRSNRAEGSVGSWRGMRRSSWLPKGCKPDGPFEIALCRAPRIYVMTYGAAVKVGVSKNPWFRVESVSRDVRRASDLEAVRCTAGENPELRLVAVGYGCAALESAIHRYLMPDHIAGEWFADGLRVRRMVRYLSLLSVLVRAQDEINPGTAYHPKAEAYAAVYAKWRGVADSRWRRAMAEARP